ncbi:MAG: phosphoglycerate dehydrogenase [Phycisphaerales bacterium]|nr:phosphoglycerate dehydrogenase [Phycisphaerales bacterium]
MSSATDLHPSPDLSDPPRVVLLEGIHPAAASLLRGQGFEVTEIRGALGPGALAEALRGAAILGLRSKTQVTAETLSECTDLLAIGAFCIGTNQVDLSAAAQRGIAVFNSPFSNTRSVAELTIAEIIALSRRLFDKSSGLHAGRWDKSAAHAHEIRGRTLGIVGYGHIGSQLSVLAEAMGMRVTFYDIAPKLPLGNAMALPSLQALLETADVVSLHVPATPLTEGMIGAAELAMMRPGSFLINNARGSVVDIGALAVALASGAIGGAAVDVFPEEPAANQGAFDCPLAGLSNAILTPHIGGSTEEAQENIARDVSSKLLRFMLNGSTTTSVNVPEVDLPLLRESQHRILHFHRNVPGVLGRMHTMLAARGVNINAEFLQSKAELSYVILDVDPVEGEAVKEGLRQIPETIRVRTLW